MVITLEEFLLQLGLGYLNLNGLVNLFLVAFLVIGVILNGGREECVDEGRLSQARFTSNLMGGSRVSPEHNTERKHSYTHHDGEGSTPLGDDLVSLVGQVGNANGRRAFGGGRRHLEDMQLFSYSQRRA
jgi:hypothetical protein